MNGQTDFTVKAAPEDFKNTLFLAMELSRATWLVATFALRLGDKINVHAIPGGDTKRLLELIGRLQVKLRARASAKCGRYLVMKQATTGFGCTGCSSTTASRTTSWMQPVSRSIAAPSTSRQTILTPSVYLGRLSASCRAIRKAAAWFVRQRPRKRMRGASIASGSDWCANVLAI
jgi:hypothetical protein